jgi:uncharacterized protein
MNRRIRISAGSVEVEAVLDGSETADAVWAALPLAAGASRWGDEVYFTVPVRMPEAADARQDMQVGELGYWPVGAAFCIFFGPTPASEGARPRAYSNVNPFGSVEGDAVTLRAVRDGDPVLVEAVPS